MPIHPTDHDYDILVHEYSQSLKDCDQKTPVKHLIQGIKEALVETKLNKEESESLQRLVLKLVHSDSKSLSKFLDFIGEGQIILKE